MGMSLLALKCPNCNGDIELDADREFGFCRFCGTKVMIQDALSKTVKLDHSDKLANLLSVGERTYASATPQDLTDLSNKILEIDADNGFGWFCKGLAAAKSGHPEPMTDAWGEAIKKMTAEEFQKYKPSIIENFVGCIYAQEEDDDQVFSTAYFCAMADDKLPDDEDMFAIQLLNGIDRSLKYRDLEQAIPIFCACTALIVDNLMAYRDLSLFGGCYETFFEVFKDVKNLKRSSEVDNLWVLKQLDSMMYPYMALNEILEESVYTEDECDAAADYWADKDEPSFMTHFNEAVEVSMKLTSAGTLSTMSVRKKVKKILETMLNTYFNRHA